MHNHPPPVFKDGKPRTPTDPNTEQQIRRLIEEGKGDGYIYAELINDNKIVEKPERKLIKSIRQSMRDTRFTITEQLCQQLIVTDLSIKHNGMPCVSAVCMDAELLQMVINNALDDGVLLLCIDGTHGVSPPGTQLVVISILTRFFTPCVIACAVVASHTAESYAMVLERLRAYGIMPTHIMSDFEEVSEIVD